MQLGSVDIKIAGFIENRTRTEAARTSRVPVDTSNSQAIRRSAKESLEQAQSSQKLNSKELDEMVERFNELSRTLNIQLRFSVNKNGPNHISVKIINVETNEVIREVPPQKIASIGSKLLHDAGLVVDETV